MEKEFEEYVEYEYLVHYSWGKVLFGKQKEFISFFTKFISQRKPNKKELIRQMYIAIVHANFNLVRKYVSFNIFNTKNYQKELLKLFIDNLLEIADWRLIANNVWCTSKKEIVRKITNISRSPFVNIVNEAYKYRKNWNSEIPKKEILERFFVNGINFINDCAIELKGCL
jgi:hypothetical protein